MEWLTVEFLNGLGTVGLSVLVAFSLIFGKGLATQRELRERDKTIEWQRLTIEEKDDQIRELIGGTRVAATALDKVSDAAMSVGGEG